MAILGVGRSHRGLGVIISMHILLNISLVGCRGKTHSFGLFAGIGLKDTF